MLARGRLLRSPEQSSFGLRLGGNSVGPSVWGLGITAHHLGSGLGRDWAGSGYKATCYTGFRLSRVVEALGYEARIVFWGVFNHAVYHAVAYIHP